MKSIFVFILFFLFTPALYSSDIMIKVQKRKELLTKAKMEKQKAIKEAEEIKKRIAMERKSLKNIIDTLKKKNRMLKRERDRLKKELKMLIKKENELTVKRDKEKEEIKELIDLIRTYAKDLNELLSRSIQSAFLKDRLKQIKPIMDKLEFPDIKDIEKMRDLLFQEMSLSRQVRIIKGASFIDRSGKEIKGEVLVIGNLEAVYRTDKETGFLIYSEPSHTLFALSRLPPYKIRKKLNSYLDGSCDDIPVDISRGSALRQLEYRFSIVDEIPRGGPIVIPILIIAAIAFVLIVERIIYLTAKDYRTDALIDKFMLYLSNGQWQKCMEICREKAKIPVFRILLSGIEARDMPREELESILQEAILNEIPKLERFLSTINILAHISPLLGLLGTVTGIINTFHAITLYGTGDPRVMSSGISEALVTTMLGLMVAIPIMFFHTLLSTKVENMISKMEKGAVSFVNTLFKQKENERISA